MKKWVVLLVALLMCVFAAGYAEEEAPERVNAEYAYTLTEGGMEYLENLIFHGDVVIQGEKAQIVFVNCEFKGDIILKANEATRVMLLGCDMAGACM
ncbi:MAG: hypothetical protein IKM05_01530, partial [Clostridia bacterium]|nr:hypothetical protein [Clostridia bacterium]